MHKVGFYFNPIFLEHINVHSPVHPEQPERLKRIIHALREMDLADFLIPNTPKRRDAVTVKQTHCSNYFEEMVRLLGRENNGEIDADTFYSSNTLKASLISANTGAEAYRDILDGKYARTFGCIRPPGHHAERTASMGFCFFNNAAITADYMISRGCKRVMIVDFDCHHGNGTQQIFYERNDVLFVSCHQIGIYPNTGQADETGRGDGGGFTINVPLPAGATGMDALKGFHPHRQRMIDFKADALVFSAGFDAHADEEIGELAFKSSDFFDITRFFLEVLPHAETPVVSLLEGGYHLDALPGSVAAHLKALIEVRPAS